MVLILRPPVAAGNFYEIDPALLRKELDSYFRRAAGKGKKVKPLAAIVPHSPYIQAGEVMAGAYTNLEKSNFIILGSDHSTHNEGFSLMRNSLWKTPIGEALTDDKMADRLMKECNIVEFDTTPHESEFSIEVQLPFLLHKFGEIKFLPIIVSNGIPDNLFLENCKIVGESIARIVRREKAWKVIGSSDLSRKMRAESTEKTDRQLIKSILKTDPEGFFEGINKTNANVCGYGAIATTLFVAKALKAKKSKLIDYKTSAEFGDLDGVKGYASFIFY